MKKTVLIFSMVFALNQFVYSQEASNVLLPSPQSREFFKHFDFPANNPNGTINYAIPIYEVKSGSLSLPIDISYVSGGSKYSDNVGEIGYNWSLNAGGRISRTIYGKPDEFKPFADSIATINSSVADQSVHFDYLSPIYHADGNFDSQFDIYSYSFGNTSGRFIYNQYDSKARTIPEKPHKVSFGEIVDDKGVTYLYQTDEQSLAAPNLGYVTSKYLNYIISADKKDTIKITYQPGVYQNANSLGVATFIHDHNTFVGLGSYMLPFPYSEFEKNTTTQYAYSVITIKEILFRGGKVVFTPNSTNTAIDAIKVFDKKNTLIKQVDLSRTNGFLNEVRFKDAVGTNVEKYKFEYYPPPTYNFSEDIYGYLKWGAPNVRRETKYYEFYHWEWNAFYEVWEVKQEYGSFYTGTFGASSGPDETSLSGMLKKVTFPTGGTAEYSYEGNRIVFGTQALGTGGMRLSEAKLTDNNGSVHYSTYKYGMDSEDGRGSKPIYIRPDSVNNPGYTSYETRVFPWTGAVTIPNGPNGLPQSVSFPPSYRKRVYTSSFLPEIAEAAQEATFYSRVTVYNGTVANNLGKTVYNYYSYGTGSKYRVDQYPAQDWTLASSLLSDVSVHSPEISDRYHITRFHLWHSFPLESTTIYKNTGTGYAPVKSVVNKYNMVQTDSLKGLHITKNIETTNPGHGILSYSNKVPLFLYDNYYITTGREDLISTTDTLYTSTGNLVTTTSYEYNSSNQVSKVTRAESGGDTKITTYTYPKDQGTTEPYRSMVIKNMVAPVIEETTYKNAVAPNNFLQSTRTDYSFWANNIAVAKTPGVDPDPNPIYPERVWTNKRGQVGTDLRSWYKSYGMYDGNVQEVYAKWPGPATSYIWGYNRLYPIAEARNARYQEIYHNNFEERTYFNSTYIVKDNTRWRTGRYSGKMSNSGSGERVIHCDTTLAIIQENKTKKFRYSGWVYSTGPGADIHLFGRVSGGALTWFDWIGTTELNKWVYLEKEFTVPANTSALNLRLDNNSAGDVWFDDLRIMPADAMMTTLTYDPLIGATSTTDNQGITTYYEYDNYQRLMNVKDKDGKIIKHMDYQYKQ